MSWSGGKCNGARAGAWSGAWSGARAGGRGHAAYAKVAGGDIL
jgi:hypothetical protein